VPKDLSVLVQNRPAMFAALRQATVQAGVQIDGVCGYANLGQKIFHLLVSDEEVGALRDALKATGLDVHVERDVLVVDIPLGPKAIGDVADRLSQANVNVDLVYLATENRLVLGVDSIDRAKTALAHLPG
jgi:hypothetical protein